MADTFLSLTTVYSLKYDRSFRPGVFCKKVFLKIFKFYKIYRKKPVSESGVCYWEILKPEAYNFIKKEIRRMCFPVNFAKFLRMVLL